MRAYNIKSWFYTCIKYARDKGLDLFKLRASFLRKANSECSSLTMMRCTLPSSQSARTSCVYSGFSQSLARQHRRADPRSSALAHLRFHVVDVGCWGVRFRCGVFLLRHVVRRRLTRQWRFTRLTITD